MKIPARCPKCKLGPTKLMIDKVEKKVNNKEIKYEDIYVKCTNCGHEFYTLELERKLFQAKKDAKE